MSKEKRELKIKITPVSCESLFCDLHLVVMDHNRTFETDLGSLRLGRLLYPSP